MKMLRLAQYDRTYTEIPGLQDAEVLRYTLFRRGQELLVSVSALQKLRRRAECVLPEGKETVACGLLLFLYENSVEPENLCDVIADVCPAGNGE